MYRRIGWQVLLVGAGFLLTAAFLVYLASTYTTEFRPAPGGTYIEGVVGSPQSLNPLLSYYNDADGDVTSLVFSGLTRVGMRGEVEPDLAESWEIDPSGITYTFRLNRNVLWHDGSYFTARDVVFTLGLLQDPDYPGPPDIGQLWRSIRIEQLEDYSVQMVLTEPFAPFLDYTTVGILPQHILSDLHVADLASSASTRSPVGTGPFRLTETQVEAGQITKVVLRRFPRYYGTPPLLESVVLQFYPTPRAALEAYEEGLVEGVSRITLDLLPEAYSLPSLNLYSAPMAEMVMLYLNHAVTETLTFNDARVRQALLYSMDRQGIVDAVLAGQALVPGSPSLPGTWAYSTAGIPQYAPDPQMAVSLLKEVGWQREAADGPLVNDAGEPFAFTLTVSNEPADLAVATEIVSHWARVGISATVQTVPPLALSAVLDSRAYQAVVAHLVIPGDPDPYPFWHETQVLPGQGQNYAGFEHRRISEIAEQARMTMVRDERLALYAEFQRLFMEELPAIPLYVPVYTYGLDSRVSGGQLAPLMRTGDRYITVSEWYILQRRVVASLRE